MQASAKKIKSALQLCFPPTKGLRKLKQLCWLPWNKLINYSIFPAPIRRCYDKLSPDSVSNLYFLRCDWLLHNKWLKFHLPFTSASLSLQLWHFSLPSSSSSSTSLHPFVCLSRLPVISSSPTTRKQLCAQDNYITVRAHVKVRRNTGRIVRDDEGGGERKNGIRLKLSPGFIRLPVLCPLVVFFLSHPFLSPPNSADRVTGLWNVKNCSMYCNSLSCQTSQGRPRVTRKHREAENEWETCRRKKKKNIHAMVPADI